MTEWMQRTLEVEYKEWFREEEPEMDHQGFFQSALPVIIMQVGPAGDQTCLHTAGRVLHKCS